MRHVGVAADARYLPHAAAALHSVLEHAGGVHAHLLHPGTLSRGHEHALAGMVEAAGGAFTAHAVEPARMAGLPALPEITQTMWLRVFLPELLPDADRVLYLDADTIAVDDLEPLFATELGDSYVAAVTNVWEPWNAGYPAELGVESYFNSGVLLLNLEAMRRDGCSGALLETARARRLSWPDQDALNLVLGERRVELHPRWNAMNSVLEFPQAAEVFGAEQVDEARRSPAIRHFEGPSVNKPWHVRCERAGREEYMRHRAGTPWPEVRLEGAGPLERARAAWRRRRPSA